MNPAAKPSFAPIVRHYEQCLACHGATPQGVDWPDGADLARRFGVMLDVRRPEHAGRRLRLLDVGCGPGLLLDYLAASGREGDVEYLGVDLSESMVQAARERWPDHQFVCTDLITDTAPHLTADYVILNGVLTEKRELPQADMVSLAETLLESCFAHARIGMAFNVMSTHVDWTRDDLFHWPMDDAMGFAARRLSRHVAIRADYGLWEYTVYVYRTPAAQPLTGGNGDSRWWES